jgi:preprotein translocase subunit SecG
MVAKDTDRDRWLAFSGPVEMGQLSYWAWQTAKNGALLARLSAIAIVLFVVLALVLSRFGRERSKMFSLSRAIGPPETPR